VSTLLDLDHAHLRRAERRWLDQCAERLRIATRRRPADAAELAEGTDR
jgi:hypothetical protein